MVVRRVQPRRGMDHSLASSSSVPREISLVLLFAVVDGSLALPCLCPGGVVAAQYKLALVGMVSIRLVASIVVRTFRFSGFCAYFAAVTAFCVWTEMLY